MLGVLSSLASVLSIVKSIFGWFSDRAKVEQGEQLQRQANDDATIKQAERAQEIDADVRRMSDASLNRELRASSHDE